MRGVVSVLALFAFAGPAAADNLDALVAKHAAANGVPEQLVRRIIKIESRGQPHLISKGNYGLMQIRLGTARAMGYTGDGQGLLDADTNMTYAVRYLAGAYRAADGNLDRAVHFYQRGYYYDAKAKGFSPYVATPPTVAALLPIPFAAKPAAPQKPAPQKPAPQMQLASTTATPVAAPADKPAAPKKSAKVDNRPFNLLSYLAYYGNPGRAADKKHKPHRPVAKTASAVPAAAAPAATTATATPAAQKP